MNQIKVRLLSDAAQIPTRGSDHAAGLDIRTTDSVVIPPGKRALLGTGLAFAIPTGFYGRIAPRSKLAAKFGIDVLAGVVDADYRGEVRVSLLNTGEDAFEVCAGDKIAQLILEACSLAVPVAVDELDDTERGASGIGDSELRLR